MDRERLKEWFIEQQRDFPWRVDHSPYRVWISEVMLQQTRAEVVVPYFERFMERFPSIAKLAEATVEEVIKQWEGLGYYSRARNLHAAARKIVEEYRGELPSTEEKLAAIKGLGPYTIGAIRSFAFREKAAAVDGNVMRVICRYYGIDGDISRVKTQRAVREKVLNLLPDVEPWVVSEGLIELGATICKKRAVCSSCPVKKGCYASLRGVTDKLPVSSKKVSIEKLHKSLFLLLCNDSVLLMKGKKGEVMEGLYQFPTIDRFEGEEEEATIKRAKELLNLSIETLSTLPKESHSFTRYIVHLYPTICKTVEARAVDNYFWHPLAQLEELPFSSGHRRVMLAAKEGGHLLQPIQSR